MNAKIQKLIGTAVLGLAVVAQSLPAWAGAVAQSEVTITTSTAYGSMAGARYSTDSQQYIGCTLQNSGGGFVRCTARDKAGKYFTCGSTDVRLTSAAKALTDFSYLAFSITPGSSSCSDLQVYNSSFYQ